MSKKIQKQWYYCILAYVERIDRSFKKPEIHVNKNIEYTLAYKYDDDSVYYDVRTSKCISILDKNTVKENNWYIISTNQLDVDFKDINNYDLRRLINYLPRLENKVKTMNKTIKKGII